MFLGSCSLWQNQLGTAAKPLNPSSEGRGHYPVVDVQGLAAEAWAPESGCRLGAQIPKSPRVGLLQGWGNSQLSWTPGSNPSYFSPAVTHLPALL